MFNKKELRQIFIKRRIDTPHHIRARDNHLINVKMLDHPEIRQKKCPFIFVGTRIEFNTSSLIDFYYEKGLCFGLPRIYDGHQMKAHEFCGWDRLTENRFGILEPQAETPIIQNESIDMVVLPCVAANSKGYRLGFGGGYYDRFLKDLSPDVLKVLPVSTRYLFEELPTETHDIPADLIITENELIDLRGL